MNKKGMLICIVWAFILFGAAGAQAQVRELQLNQPASGELTGGTQRDFYRVQVEANQHLVIFVQKPSGWDSAVYVRYESLTGEPVAEEQTWPDDDDSILEIPRTQAGSYYIEVTSDWTGDIGEYTILATLAGGVPPTTLELGETLTDSITSGGWRDYEIDTFENENLLII
ncbi:MAG TPA: hypothetical protein ENG51_16885, partial [Deltaproteobacteria bacterium]|nr:hypothetical protein [Deltaproteobacteria bacterium]